MFRLGVWNGGNLVRTDLCLSQFLDTYISNLLHFDTECHRILYHCAELYYICASSVEKKKTECTWLPNGVFQCQRSDWLAFVFSFFCLIKKKKKAAHLIWGEKTHHTVVLVNLKAKIYY